MKKGNEAALYKGKGKFLLVARLLVCMTLLPVVVMATPVFSQQRVSMKMKDASLEQVLKEIQRASGYYILYNTRDVKPVKGVSVEMTDAAVEEALDAALRGTSLRYVIEERTILIARRGAREQEQVKRVIQGTILDEGKQPVPGATIRVKGLLIGASSGIDGTFRLEVAGEEPVTLLISCVGMESVEVVPEEGKSLTVVLKERVEEMGEVVVTGIFARRRESYTGAVTTVAAEELRRASNANLLTQIANIDPSFHMLENNAYGSDPNRLPDIQMRGSTSLSVGMRELQDESQSASQANMPLFIVDGFEVEQWQVQDMDPSLAESITLLKDASSTALYGSRGANGVMVITTRKPPKGQLRLTYKGDLNVEAPDLTSYNLMNATEKLEFERLSGIYDQGGNPAKNQEYKEAYLDRLQEVKRGVDTYWLKYPVRVGVGQRHSLRLEGGSEEFRYAVHASYQNVAGAMKDSRRSTLSGGMLLRYDRKAFTFQNELIATFNRSENSPYGSFSLYAQLNPYYVPRDEEGKLKKMLEERYSPFKQVVGNPLYDASLPSRNDAGYDQVRDNLAVDWRLSPELKARLRASFTRQSGRSDVYVPAKNSRFETTEYEGENFSRRGTYDYGTNYMFRYEADATVDYSTLLGDKHAIYAGLNYRVSENRSESHAVRAEGYAAANMHLFGVANGYEKDKKPTSSEAVARALGGVLNAGYTYDNRYFADASVKVDASSQFGARRRYAPFWSIGAGWNVHRERFIAAEWISNLRARVSYGVSGAQKFKPYQAMTTFYYHERNYRYWNGYYMMALGNENLKWETTGQFNAGIDAELFDRRVRLYADFYNKETYDLLADVNTAPSSGFLNYKDNIGKVRNRGVELTFTVYPVMDKRGRTFWSISGSLVHNKNTVLKISDALEELNKAMSSQDRYAPSYLVREGQSLNTIYAVRSLGIDPSNGQEVLVKSDGAKVFGDEWSSADKVPCGVADPKAWGLLNTMFRRGNFSCTMIFGYRLGADVYNQTLVEKVENVDPLYNADRRAFYDRWKTPGDRVKFKGMEYYQVLTGASSRFVMKEYMLDCRSINVSWDWDSDRLRRAAGVERLTVSAHTEDVFRFSTIRRERGTAYPFARSFSLTLSALF